MLKKAVLFSTYWCTHCWMHRNGLEHRGTQSLLWTCLYLKRIGNVIIRCPSLSSVPSRAKRCMIWTLPYCRILLQWLREYYFCCIFKIWGWTIRLGATRTLPLDSWLESSTTYPYCYKRCLVSDLQTCEIDEIYLEYTFVLNRCYNSRIRQLS